MSLRDNRGREAMSTSREFAIVAALPREISEIVHGWRVVRRNGSPVYLSERAVLAYGGTGQARAAAAARRLIENYSPKVVISLGFAGACEPALAPGSLFVPAEVRSAATGRRFACATGSGVLVSADQVASRGLKQRLHGQYQAAAVDMEAAGVAAVAAEHGLQFAAIKAISDGGEADLDFLDAFTTPEVFRTGRFVAYLLWHPRLWSRVAALAQASQQATKAMAVAANEAWGDWQGFREKHSKSSVSHS